MKKWTLLDQVLTPDKKKLELWEHDGHYTIRVEGLDLMSTRLHASEDKLAEVACAHVRTKRGARVLIGGLGCGFTLRVALAHLPKDSKVVVAEIMAEVIGWNKNPAYKLAADCMTDRRVQIVHRDVAQVIKDSPAGFDGIMLDVDNGPAALSSDDNRSLYVRSGLLQAKEALRPGGCVVYWSAVEDPIFAKLMTKVGFKVDVQRARAHTTSGGWHTLFVGRV